MHFTMTEDYSFFAHLRNPFPVPSTPPLVAVPDANQHGNGNASSSSSSSSSSASSSQSDEPTANSASSAAVAAASVAATTTCAVVSLDLSPAIPAAALPDTFAQVASNFVTARHVSQGHPALCQLVDCVRGHVCNSRRVYLVQEAHAKTLSSILLASASSSSSSSSVTPAQGAAGSSGIRDPMRLLRWAHVILSGLAFLHAHGMQHRNLHLHNIFLVSDGSAHDQVKLFNFATYFVTNNGQFVATPVTAYAVQPPEVVLLPLTADSLSFSSFKADTWAFGLLLWHLYFGSPLLPTADPRLLFATFADFCKRPDTAVTDYLAQRMRRFQLTRPHLAAETATSGNVDDPIVQLILAALVVNPKHRPMPCDLLRHPVFHAATGIPRALVSGGSPDQRTNLSVLFHLWLAGGGNLDSEYMRATGAANRPAVLQLPCELRARDSNKSASTSQLPAASTKLPRGGAEGSGNQLSGHDRFPFPLNLKPILESIWHITPAVACSSSATGSTTTTNNNNSNNSDTAAQFQRIQHLASLLLTYPLSLPTLHSTLHTSMSSSSTASLIPPLLRPDLWLALLNVTGPVRFLFSTHDLATTPGSSSADDDTLTRQLDADTQRCHTYHPYISSAHGQTHLQRLIRAWLHAHPTRVYWQGFDSVCAVFLSLFPGEHLLPYAFAALDAFVARYLEGFLGADNHAALQAYFARLKALLMYMDPELGTHMLDGIGLGVDLFSVPWALTACAHVLPLPLVYLVWDYLLVVSARGEQEAAFLLHVLVACLRAPTIRPGIMQARSFDEALHRIVEVSLQEFARALEGAKVQSRGMPKSTHAALMREDSGVGEVVMRMSLGDALAESDAVRVIDVRFEALPPPGTLHIKSSTFVPPSNLHAIENILKQQRLNKRITLLRSLDVDEAAKACKRLIEWGIAGVCWLEEGQGSSADKGKDKDKVCMCTPTAISLPAAGSGGGHVIVYKCTH